MSVPADTSCVVGAFSMVCCPEWEVNSGDGIQLVQSTRTDVHTNNLFFSLARSHDQVYEYQRMDNSNDASLNIYVGNNTNLTCAGGNAHAVSKCVLTSNAKFVEVYDCKGVYIETFKGCTAERNTTDSDCLSVKVMETVPLFTVDITFKSPLMISSAKDTIIKLKPISLKVKTDAGLKPSNSLFWLEDISVQLLAVDAHAVGPGAARLGAAAAAAASALSETMRAEDIFDLSTAMSTMGLTMGGGYSTAGIGAGMGMHSDLLKALLPSIMPALSSATSSVPAPVSVTSAPAVNCGVTTAAPPPVPVPTVGGNIISIDRGELSQLVERLVDARTVALHDRVNALESQVARLLESQNMMMCTAATAAVGTATITSTAAAKKSTANVVESALMSAGSNSNSSVESHSSTITSAETLTAESQEILNYEFV